MAVKPKDYKDVCKIIKEDLNKDALVLSVMAGVKLKSLKKELPYNTKFVRLMTNLNIKIFQGSSFIYANKEVKNIDKKRIENYWSSLIEMYNNANKNKFGDKNLQSICKIIKTFDEFSNLF